MTLVLPILAALWAPPGEGALEFVTPTDKSVTKAGEITRVEVHAVGPTAFVELLVDGAQVERDDSAPFEFELQLEPGLHRLQAVSGGAESAEIQVAQLGKAAARNETLAARNAEDQRRHTIRRTGIITAIAFAVALGAAIILRAGRQPASHIDES